MMPIDIYTNMDLYVGQAPKENNDIRERQSQIMRRKGEGAIKASLERMSEPTQWLPLRTGVLGVFLLGSQVNRDLALGSTRESLLQTLQGKKE